MVYYSDFKPDELAFVDELIPLLKEHGLEAESERMCDCGRKYNAFTYENAHEHPVTNPFVFSYRCELRICPRCSKVWGRIVRKESQELLTRFDKTKTHRFGLLTLTQKHALGEELTAGKVNGFNQKVRKLINLLYPKKTGCAALAVTEIGANLNIHAHVLVYGPSVPQQRISAAWLRITGDSAVVDIRSARDHVQAPPYVIKYILQATCVCGESAL